MPWALEPSHAPFALARRLVGVLGGFAFAVGLGLVSVTIRRRRTN